ncbi:uncharacterized protein [Rutidosis leptorrhynchoides]|uniref:uncharacterized protein n=1 Tax=Rutidosis leptorrhynchoides TaxID=125765 RepID=UPI003A999577
MDADMMDSDTPMTSPSRTPEISSVSGQIEVPRRLLALARQLIDQGKPSHALQAVIFYFVYRFDIKTYMHARLCFYPNLIIWNKIQESNAADELASLFAECAIAEALPSVGEPPRCNDMAGHWSLEPDASGTSILSETGRKQIMLDAFSDGSSFICLHCGGLVSSYRKDEHYTFWCGQM